MNTTMKNEYNKTYYIEDSLLEGSVKLEFNTTLEQKFAMITCTSFADLSSMLDILYIEGLKKIYKVETTYMGNVFVIILYNKLKGDN